MTAYTNFTSDFPSRCLDILDITSSLVQLRGRDVTLLLVVASASLLVPFERLKPDNEYSAHPFGDNRRFKDAAKRLEELLEQNFVGSVICSETHNSWRFAKNVQRVDGDLDAWFPPEGLKPIGKNKKVKSMLSLIRNALAHGNIYSRGDPIDELIFVQERRQRPSDDFIQNVTFEVLSISHHDFQKFIRGWIGFLTESKTWELRLVA